MFTGIIEEVGIVRKKSEEKLEIEANKIFDDLRTGDSVAVDGICLTVSSIMEKRFTVDIVSETKVKTTLGGMKTSAKVNLERALKASDRLGGHFVTGHVDGVGTVTAVQNKNNSLILTIGMPEKTAVNLVDQGAVAIDGVSLTVQSVDRNTITIAIIPYTLQQTTLGTKTAGSKVNIELDVLAKYVKKFMVKRDKKDHYWDGFGQIEEGA